MPEERVLFKLPDRGWRNPGRVVMNLGGDPILALERIAECYELLAAERIEAFRSEDLHSASHGYYGVYPIVFLYRQALELSLKAIIYAGDVLVVDLGETPIPQQQRNTHALTPLFAEVCRIFAKLNGDAFWRFLGPPALTRTDLRALIGEFDSVDRGSYAFRYSITKNGTTLSLDCGFEFDLFAFAETMNAVLPGLRAAPGVIRDHMQARWESAYEARQGAWADEEHECGE